jgi:hypothetical protein
MCSRAIVGRRRFPRAAANRQLPPTSFEPIWVCRRRGLEAVRSALKVAVLGEGAGRPLIVPEPRPSVRGNPSPSTRLGRGLLRSRARRKRRVRCEEALREPLRMDRHRSRCADCPRRRHVLRPDLRLGAPPSPTGTVGDSELGRTGRRGSEASSAFLNGLTAASTKRPGRSRGASALSVVFDDPKAVGEA